MRRIKPLLSAIPLAVIGLTAVLLTLVTLVIVINGFNHSKRVAAADETAAPHGAVAAAQAATPTPAIAVTAIVSPDPTLAVVNAYTAAHDAAAAEGMTGQQIFALRCAPCHGPNGEGLIGPSFRDRPVLPLNFVLSRVRSGPEVMSAFSPDELPDAQVAAVVDYLEAEIVAADLPVFTEDEIAQGKALYREYCVECHGSFGQGKQDVGPVINLWPPMGIGQIVKGGLLPLPNMPRLAITPDELYLVAGYIQSWGNK
jgi:mono/diheme cytochrome c family protein